VRIDELCDINPKHGADLADDVEVSFVPMAAVSDVAGEITEPETRRLGDVRRGYTHFSDGDVLWAKITPCMENGKSAVARGLVNGVGCGTTEFFVLRSHGAVVPEFLHQFMRQQSYRDAARGTMQSGVGQARVPKNFIEATILDLPPLAEQRRILARIAQLRSRSHSARDALDVIPTLLNQFRQSVLAAAFRGDLTDGWRATTPQESGSVFLDEIRAARRDAWSRAGRVKRGQANGIHDHSLTQYKEPPSTDSSTLPRLPASWTWATATELSSAVYPLSYGVVQPGHEVEEGVSLLRVCDIGENGEIAVDGMRKIDASVDDEHRRTRLRGGEIVMSLVGTIGRTAIVPEALRGGNIARAIARIEPSTLVPARWIARFLQSPAMQEWLNRESREVARKTLNLGTLASAPIPLAPPAEMKEILRKLDELLAKHAEVTQLLMSQAAEIDRVESAILDKAFRGELVPQDSDDEPASVLLERIRAERAAAPAKQRRGVRARARR
jgi:type I restriction enzyme S subunit